MTWHIPNEAEYSPPRPACPHPEYWTAENIMATEKEVSEFIGAMVVATQPENILEIGAHYGQTTEEIAKAVLRNKHGNFVSIEVDHDLAGVARARVGDLPVAIIEANSATYLPPQPVDFLFIDGGNDRLSDFQRYLGFCGEHALILVHDTVQDYQVEQAEQMKLSDLHYVEFHTPRGLLLFTR